MSLMDNLFFDGDLQAGISLAIANDKKIVCFVTGWYDEHLMYENDWLTDFLASGNNDESLLWQDTFLRDDEVPLHITLGHQAPLTLHVFLSLGCRGPRLRSYNATHTRTLSGGWPSVGLLPGLKLANSDTHSVRLSCLSYIL